MVAAFSSTYGVLGLKWCSSYSFSSIQGSLRLDVHGGYSICSIYGVYRGWKFAVVTAFGVLTCTRHCSWTSKVVTALVVFMGVGVGRFQC